MMAVALTGFCFSSQTMQQQHSDSTPQLRTVLLQLRTLKPTSTAKLAKKTHTPVVMHISRSNSPTKIEDHIREEIVRQFSISPSHHLELLDQDHMNAQDAEKYFTKPTGHLDAPSDSPLCLVVQECDSPKTPLEL